MNGGTKRSRALRLRDLWLQVHKWIGLGLAVLIVPLSLSGAALVWHDPLDRALNPQRYAVTGGARLGIGAYEAAARAALAPGERLVSLRLPEHGGPVVATAARPGRPGMSGGPPARTQIWLDPATGKPLDRAGSNAGPVRFIHVLHGSLQVPGVGRQIVGWLGVAMLLSSLTGLWLWWPLGGRWTRGLRWRRRNETSSNLHHQAGFWIALPLAMLSATGTWIAFPAFFGAFTGESGQAMDRARAARAQPLDRPALSAEQAVAAAARYAAGPVALVTWPTDRSPAWKLSFAGQKEVEVADSTGRAAPPKSPRPETLARTMRRWHDGTGMGPLWQAAIFVAGLLPALLAVTGILMWLNARRWRAKAARRTTSAA
jgi:uncharacterized iron-regulated membrane protein